MAVRTETVSYHSCDLCGQDYDEADLTRLYGPPAGGQARAGRHMQDVPGASGSRGGRVAAQQAGGNHAKAASGRPGCRWPVTRG